MKRKIAVAGAAAVAAGALISCGGDDNSSSAPPLAPQTTDTAQVLATAQNSSEVSTPFQVNGTTGGLTFTDTSETTTPISVNAM
ncbi:MAG: hypothetical protein ACREU6_11115 [Steroidobacteraceae bacterium]